MKKIRVDEFQNITSIANPTFSPDGKSYAYTVSKVNEKEDTYESFIYVKKEGKEAFKLTSFGKERSFKYLDNENIIFSGNREKNKEESTSKFYKINIGGGEASLFLEFKINVVDIEALKNGDFICAALNNPKYPNTILLKDDKKIEEYKKYQKENQDYEELTEVPFYHNGAGFTKSCKMSLYYYHTKEKRLEELTSLKYNVSEFEINEEENVVFFGANTDKSLINMKAYDIYALNLGNKEIEKIISYKDIAVSGIIKYKNGFYFGGSHSETGLNTDPDFYYYDYNTKKYELVSKFGYAPWNTVGTDIRIGGGKEWKVIDDSLYFVTTYYDDAYLYRLKNKKIEAIIGLDGAVESFDIYNDKIILVGLYDMMPQELYEYQDNKLKKLTSFNDYLKEYYIAKPEKVFFKSLKDEIHGFVLKPYDYDENKKYPVILDVHGGPKTIYGKVFYHEMQYWVNEGYFVVYCNPTGSDGRGRAFSDIRGKYGTIDFCDIMNFCDKCLELYPQMDETHLYETGGSYGGFMTNWIIGHTNRFRACASQRSISNWISFFGTSDIGVGFAPDQTKSKGIWSDIDKMWESSPLKYADKVKTPTLFIHSNEDYRCPMEQGMQMYTALKYFKVDTKLVYFKGENHELSRSGKPSHRLKRLNEITTWFKKHK
ncbi:MAG: S9 family peptidase [Bacilli bacterium]|nr:S9 family peptidase [Bacilli bacterium]